MLNYIWLFLLGIGVLVAVGTDIGDLSSNRYHNGEGVPALLQIDSPSSEPLTTGHSRSCTIQLSPAELARRYRMQVSFPVIQHAMLIPFDPGNGVLHITMDAQTPPVWKEIFAASKNADYLQARVALTPSAGNIFAATVTFDQVRFVKLTAVTNDGIIKYAKTAVELAIGLIGIMALWLGLMKIAEQAGLVAALGKLLRPITTRLFPDVPADHPAMGAMILNISANMLGLLNAATPFGLKAMEELNKLNPKAGTATDAMCTFLVINTGNVQLIPATVIAIRAASGSANPTEILGPVIVATGVALFVGIVTVKLLARLPVYRKQLEVA